MEYEELWRGGPRLKQAPGVFPMGTDAVLLGAFAGVSGVKRACDIGTGTGLIALRLAWENPSMTVDAVDILPGAVELARENMALNGVEDRVSVILGDIRNHREFLTAGAYDLVISNPPYFAENSGRTVSDAQLAGAREEKTCSISELCAAGAFLTRCGGRFCLVHRPERLAAVMRAMSESGLEPKRLRLVHHRADAAPILFLVEGRRGGKPGLKIEPPLVLAGQGGGDTAEILEIYHRS